jgi:hypothetical protein
LAAPNRVGRGTEKFNKSRILKRDLSGTFVERTVESLRHASSTTLLAHDGGPLSFGDDNSAKRLARSLPPSNHILVGDFHYVWRFRIQ